MYRQKLRHIGVLLGGMLAVAGSAGAQVISMSFEEMVAAADTIVVAEAIDSRAEWVTTAGHRNIVTRVTFRVTETFKGIGRMLLPLEFVGGTVGNEQQHVSGVPTFQIGDRAVLFVSGTRSISPVVGHNQGRFPINVAPDGTEYVTLPNRRAFSAVSQIAAPVTVSPEAIPTMTLAAFRDAVGRLLPEQQ